MFKDPLSSSVGSVSVVTSSGTGLSPEHWADRAMKIIMNVAQDSASPIKDQALAFQESIRHVVLQSIKEAIKSDRTTIYNLLLQQGETEMAEIIRRF